MIFVVFRVVRWIGSRLFLIIMFRGGSIISFKFLMNKIELID